MRWDNLFDDLEGQLEHELRLEDVDLQAEEERLRLGRLTLRDRLLAIHAAGLGTTASPVSMVLADGGRREIAPAAFGRDWLSGDVSGASRLQQCIVPLAAIAGLVLDREQLAASLIAREVDGHTLADRLGLSFVIRDLCRRRRAVEVVLASGAVHGTIDRVGRDHFDLAVHEPGAPRRESNVLHHRVVGFDALVLVKT